MIEILLIDDDVQLGALMGDYLLPQGFRVTASATGEEGVDLALSGRFALVLLDVMLPGIDGIEVLRRVRARSAVA
ncbi:response regulator transcription factor, partial [Salmonella enterica subsp. enterica serovar Heidelberg]|nr:response regulator transcription factor [Salmonella enterica subsp. enterica serovar Heidelberg]